ncbi:MAG TPA: hypothetical protein VN732_09545 [Solirubrobacterales bacterium]|nr:hypothetical protein [Solirubrobacterales bacterium]
MNAQAESTGPYPDDFYGFRDVPFHVHLGMRFERPDPNGDAIVTLPPAPELLNRDGTQSPAAVYTVGEVASGISLCDALALYGGGGDDEELVPLVLTRRTEFAPAPAAARGDLRSRARFAEDADAATERLRTGRKANVEVECDILAADDEVVGTLRVYFYVRLMSLSRLESIAGQMVPGMAERAREVLGAARAARS